MTDQTIPIRIDSHEDASVNFVADSGDGGFYESRLVQRSWEKPICYLSSHSGCSYSCRFCHLTATGQTMMRPATLEDYLRQAEPVLAEYGRRVAEGQPAGKRINFNFMARGEPLANPVILENSSELYRELGNMAAGYELPAQFKVSSILPRDFQGNLQSILEDERSQFYYSLYSMDPSFRKRWLPKAMEPQKALDLIANWQAASGRPIVLHWAFIKGQNDGVDGIDQILEAVEQRGIVARFNLVRYNPHDARHGEEPAEVDIQSLFAQIQARLDQSGPGGSRIIPRVGKDVAASCGMFIEQDDSRLTMS
jgi:23S rRNA (adenine2503-C2)-methyltransferase